MLLFLRGSIFFYMLYPAEWLFVSKSFSTFVMSEDLLLQQTYFTKVFFAKILTRNWLHTFYFILAHKLI